MWERSDLSVYSVVNFRGGKVPRKVHSHFMKSECGYVLLGLVMVRPIFHEKWDEKVPRQRGIGLTV